MKKIILSFTILLISGCSTLTSTFIGNYNTAFINADETILLREGMNSDMVLDQIGVPLYVDFGIAGTIVWVYEVRTVTVQSRTSATGEMIPNKTNSITRHSKPIHQLKVTFVGGLVEKWEVSHDDNETQKDQMTPDEKVEEVIFDSDAMENYQDIIPENGIMDTVEEIENGKMPFTVMPELWWISTAVNRGGGVGIAFFSNHFGVEMNVNSSVEDIPVRGDCADYDYFGYCDEWYEEYAEYNHGSTSISLLYRNTLKSFNYILGSGISGYHSEPQHNYSYSSYYSSQIHFKVAIGKNFNIGKFGINPMLEFNFTDAIEDDFGLDGVIGFNFDF